MIQQRQVFHAKTARQMENGYSVCCENIFAWTDDNIFSVQNTVNKNEKRENLRHVTTRGF